VLIRLPGERFHLDGGYARWQRHRRIVLSIVLPALVVLLVLIFVLAR
jgi:ABC-type sugar transport system permease subunit